MKPCNVCQGRGSYDPRGNYKCRACDGSGNLLEESDLEEMKKLLAKQKEFAIKESVFKSKFGNGK